MFDRGLKASPHIFTGIACLNTIRRGNDRENHMSLAAKTDKAGDCDVALEQYQRRLKKEPGDPEILFHIGNVYQKKRDFELAIKAYRQALSYDPNFFEALLNLSVAMSKTGRFVQAMKVCRQALLLQPDSAPACNHAGTMQFKLGNCQEALQWYRKAITLKPHMAEAYFNSGNVLKKEGRLDSAEKAYRQAISLKPDLHQAFNSLGDLYRSQGRNEDAMQAYEEAIALKPENVIAYRSLAAIRKFSGEDRFVRGMKSLMANAGLNPSERMSLNFALGKAHEDLKQFDAAFEYMAEGNRLKRATFEYDKTATENLFANIREAFSKDFFNASRGHGVEDPTPIFIIGMPRSGTSLVEQVLSRHRDVFGAGELPTLDQIVTAYGKKVFKQSYPGFIPKAAREDFLRMGTAYIGKIRNLNPDAVFITDKMPQNFLFAGLIKVILPKATIIHCVRNPKDTCLSIFKNDFTRLHKYGYDLDEIGHYYRLYQELMQHWLRSMPGFIEEFRYEEMVTTPEKQVRRLLACCGLAWDDRCLSFHESSRPVLTASTAQVRKPFYKDSIALWRNYEKQMAPLFVHV